MRNSHRVLAIGFGVLVLAGLAGKLVWNHREDRLADAFRTLSAGLARLKANDTAGAGQQFQESIEEFEALGRDPVMGLHYAFAAKLRSNPASVSEVREFSVPAVRSGEVLLALALSEDSRLLAVATRHRLLCLLVDDERWAQWDLPKPVKSIGALHVDSKTGKAHAVTGDDGKLVTGDCRASNASLAATASATGDQASVAWLDLAERVVWLAQAKPDGTSVKIVAQPLPGTRTAPVSMRVTFPGEANTLFGKAAVVHSIARIDGDILLFYGDHRTRSSEELRDESVLVTSIADPDRQTNRLVFAARSEEEGGKVRWHSTHVQRLLPASVPGRVYAVTDAPAGVAVLGSNAKPVETHADALFATDHQDGREVYDFSVRASGTQAFFRVAHRIRTAARLDYELPWQFSQEPKLASISGAGRAVVVASTNGAVLMVDLSKRPAE